MMFEMAARSCASSFTSSSSSMTAPRRVTTMMTHHRRHENFGQKQRHRRCIKNVAELILKSRRLEVNAGGGYAVSPEIEATRKPTPPTNPNLPKVLVAGGGIAGLITGGVQTQRDGSAGL